MPRAVKADVVQAALRNILDGLTDGSLAPAVRISNTKARVRRLMNQVDSVAAEVQVRRWRDANYRDQ